MLRGTHLVQDKSKNHSGCELSSNFSLFLSFSYRGIILLLKAEYGISLVVQQLRLHAANAGGLGLIPGQETKIPHTTTKPTRHNYWARML